MRFIALIFALSALLSVQTVPGSPSPNQSAPDFTDARRLMQQGKYDQAIAQLQELSAKDPGLKGLPHELGTAYYKKGDYMKAVESLKAALEQNPHDNEAVQLLGLSYYLSGRPAEAIPQLEKVQTWYGQTWTPPTFSGFAISRLKTIRTREALSPKCSTSRLNLHRRISLPLACCFVRSLIQSLKSTRKKLLRLIPSFRWPIFFWVSSICSSRGSPNRLLNSRKSWRLILETQRPTTSWQTPTRASRSSMTPNGFSSAQFGWMRPLPGRTS